MKSQKTNNAEVFAISLEDFLPAELAGKVKLVYAPLADSGLIVTLGQWEKIKNVIDRDLVEDKDTMETVSVLTEEDGNILEKSKVRHEHDFQNLTILPTNRCNFKCGFCYSAHGRSMEELEPNHAFAAIDHFMDGNEHERLSLSILGGGEPLIAWNNTRKIIEYAKSKALYSGKQINVSITTNGSLLNDEIIDFIRNNKIVTVVSYEILERIQNLHRGHYETVKYNIHRMFELGCRPQFNTVITTENVDNLREIVETAHAEFPGLRYLCMDPVIQPELFESVEHLRRYHDAFIEGFFEARSIGKEMELTVDCTANISMDCTIARYCPGEMGVTAHGFITLCPCVSSEKEAFFQDFVYGRVSDDGIFIDGEKFQKLMGASGYDSKPCVQCPMKYNCAGGCAYQNKMLSSEFKKETCRFTREFGRRFLFERLNDEIKAEGMDLITLLKNEADK